MSDKNKFESPALPNNFSGKKPNDDKAPNIGSPSFKTAPNSKDRGQDGTSK